MYIKINMDINFNDIINFDELDVIKKAKIVFIFNALEKGWSVKKQNDKYIFTKKHENKREIFEENYLEHFIISNSTEHCFLDN